MREGGYPIILMFLLGTRMFLPGTRVFSLGTRMFLLGTSMFRPVSVTLLPITLAFLLVTLHYLKLMEYDVMHFASLPCRCPGPHFSSLVPTNPSASASLPPMLTRRI